MVVKASLYKHQQEAVQQALERDAFALLMEQGTGKTLSAIAAMGIRFRRGQVKKALIISPLSVVGVWERELKQFANFPYRATPLVDMPINKRKERLGKLKRSGEFLRVILLNYEAVPRMEKELKRWKPDLIILDESQKIKNRSAKQSKALHRLGEGSPFRMILTGTPVTQSPLDFWSQYRFLDSSVFGKRYSEFERRYAVKGGWMGKQVVDYNDLEDLAEKAHSIAYRITKEEALDLPPAVDQVLEVSLSREAQAPYRQMLEEFMVTLEEGEVITAPIVLTQLLRLQQITGGFVPSEEGGYVSLSCSKLKSLEELLEDLPRDEKVVVFARFLPEIEAIMEVFRKVGRRVVTLDKKRRDREDSIRQFQENPRVTGMVAQIQKGGLGISFTAASIVVFFSTTFSFADYEQAKARAHRIGQTRKVTFIHLITRNTIDEDIFNVLKEKQGIAHLVVNVLGRGVKMSKKSALEEKLLQLKEELEKEYGDDDVGEDFEEAPSPPKKKGRKESKKETTEPSGRVKKKKRKPSPTPKEEEVNEEEEGSEDDLVTAKELAFDLGISGAQLRKKLRKLVADGDIEPRENGRWEWPRGSRELKRVKRLLG